MDQSLLEFDLPTADPLDRVGFDIGWDHAHHGLVPPPELTLAGTPITQGWAAGRAVFGRRTLRAGRGVRRWLELRIQAWREGTAFEGQQVTPQYLTQLETPFCPVTRAALGGSSDGDDAPVIVRLREDAGYAAGNLVVLCRRAARARAGRTAAQLIEHSLRLQRDRIDHADGLDLASWTRLTALASLAVEMPHLQATRIPLRVLPPNRVRLLNPAQGLQLLLTLRLQAAGWSRRARAVADLLPRAELRHEFNLFVGALAARLMTIAIDAAPHQQRWGCEDAWACPRVQRRWSAFAQAMSADECEALSQHLTRAGLAGAAGVRLMVHERAQATEGWALASSGRLLRSGRAGLRRPAAAAPRLECTL